MHVHILFLFSLLTLFLLIYLFYKVRGILNYKILDFGENESNSDVNLIELQVTGLQNQGRWVFNLCLVSISLTLIIVIMLFILSFGEPIEKKIEIISLLSSISVNGGAMILYKSINQEITKLLSI